MVTVANTKMMVRPASRILSAISFGVFCRSAPSTSRIMRSMKVDPCAAVMRTRIQSDNTCVPPVTAERSPPLSRITGADSPVMAASLTEAMPSITSPSLGIKSPVSTRTTSPGFNCVAGTGRQFLPPASSRLAVVSVFVLRRLAAWALPRPSATASAKFANTTVNQSQTLIWNENAKFAPPVNRSRRKRMVVRTVTISTTNITGLPTMWRGWSFLKASPIAGISILESVIVAAGMPLRVLSMPMCFETIVSIVFQTSIKIAGVHGEVFDHRTERERGEIGETVDDQNHADEQTDEQRRVCGECAGRRRNDLLGSKRACDRQHRHDHQEAANHHRKSDRHIIEERVG